MKVRLLAPLAALFMLTLAACGGNNTVTYSPPTPGPTCSPGVTVQMIYPIPGATAVPDNPQQFVFAVSSPLPSYWDAYGNTSSTYNPNSGFLTIAGMQTISSSQVPSPAATPSFANPTYQSITLANGLTAATTYYIWLNDYQASNNCTPYGPLGSFTTQ